MGSAHFPKPSMVLTKMDPDLMHQVVLNTTNASPYRIVLILNQPSQSYVQILANIGAIIAGVITLIFFLDNFFSKVNLFCSPIRDISFFCAENSSGIIPELILYNNGGSSVVIEFIAIKLLRITPNKEEYTFIAYEGSIEDKAKKGTRQVSNFLDKPVSPFVVKDGAKVVNKKITFMRSPGLDFVKGEYILKLLITYQGICYLNWLKGWLKGGDKKVVTKVLEFEQKIHVNIGLAYVGDGQMQFTKTQMFDPKSGELSF